MERRERFGWVPHDECRPWELCPHSITRSEHFLKRSMVGYGGYYVVVASGERFSSLNKACKALDIAHATGRLWVNQGRIKYVLESML